MKKPLFSLLLLLPVIVPGIGLGFWLGIRAVNDVPRPALLHSRARLPGEAVLLVAEAGKMLEHGGSAAFTHFTERPRFTDPDLYIFVLGPDGTILFHGRDKALVGQSIAKRKDSAGRPLGDMLVGAANQQGIWAARQWHNPARRSEEWLLTYIRRTGNGFLVAADIFGGVTADSAAR